MTFLFEKKMFRFQDIQIFVFGESANLKIFDVIKGITALSKLHFPLFNFRTTGSINLKFDQILVQLLTNISKFFLALFL